MNEKNKHKIAVITGGASGIGLAIAEQFTREGILSIIIGRDQDKLQKAVERLGPLCKSIAFDLTNLERIPGLVEEIIQTYGPIDILVNNAGINMKKVFTEVSDEDFQRILLTNLTSVFAMSRETVKQMVPRRQG